MMNEERAAVRRILYIDLLVDTILRSRPDWKARRRYLGEMGLDHIQEVIFSKGEKHSRVSLDVSHDSLESIRRKFHFLEADFLHYLNPTHAIALTELPTPDKVELPPEPEIIPFPVSEEPGVITWAKIIAAGLLIFGAAAGWAWMAWKTYPY